MKNLLKQILKEDFFAILPWLFIPLIGALTGLKLTHLTGIDGFSIITVISITILAAGPFIGLIILVLRDNDRFYGKYAALYSTYPASTRKISLARLLNYTILGIFMNLVLMVNIFLVAPLTNKWINFAGFFREIKNVLSLMTYDQYMVAVKGIFSIFVFGIMISLTMMAALSIGNSYYFKRLGKWGSTFVAVCLVIIENLIQIKLFAQYSVNASIYEGANASINFFEMNYIFVIFVILELALLYFATEYFHKKKLSVA